jgi:hypothetical protein
MYSTGDIWITIFAVILSLLLVGGFMYGTYKLFATGTKDVLVRFILMVFAALTGVYVVDKIIAFKINLLTEGQSKELFDLIKTLVLMIFSYYFGTQKHENKE